MNEGSAQSPDSESNLTSEEGRSRERKNLEEMHLACSGDAAYHHELRNLWPGKEL